MCKIYTAWEAMIAAAPKMDSKLEPWRYDLVNTGREVLDRWLTRKSPPPQQSIIDTLIYMLAIDRSVLPNACCLIEKRGADIDRRVATYLSDWSMSLSVGGCRADASRLAEIQHVPQQQHSPDRHNG